MTTTTMMSSPTMVGVGRFCDVMSRFQESHWSDRHILGTAFGPVQKFFGLFFFVFSLIQRRVKRRGEEHVILWSCVGFYDDGMEFLKSRCVGILWRSG